MTPYWIIYSIPIVASLFDNRFKKKFQYQIYFLTIIILTIFIGLRHGVGGDWPSFFKYYSVEGDRPLLIFHTYTSLAYYFLLKVFYKLGLSIYSFHLFLSIVFFWCFHQFVKKEQDVFLPLIIAIPYIITVAVIGYARQGLALGFIMYSFVFLTNDQRSKFIICTLLATFMHISAIFNFIFLLAYANKLSLRFFLSVCFVIVITYFLYDIDKKEIHKLFKFYIGSGVYFESAGVKFRIILNAIPSLIFIFFAKQLAKNHLEKNLYLLISIFSLSLFLFMGNNSTFIDRLLIYLTPIQVIVFSRISILFASNYYKFLIKLCIITLYLLLYFIHFNFSLHGHSWHPYFIMFDFFI